VVNNVYELSRRAPLTVDADLSAADVLTMGTIHSPHRTRLHSNDHLTGCYAAFLQACQSS
jgi:ethanolamine utilization microcompartment shell protein EutL